VNRLASIVACAGCGAAPTDDEPYPFRCPSSGTDDVDHVMTRVLDPAAATWPTGGEANPFVHYRQLFNAYHLAIAHGMSDAEYVDLVKRLDKEVAAVDGHGFSVTPFGRADGLSARLGFLPEGGVWVKDETENVSGSHKARHLMGVMIRFEVVERLGLGPARGAPRLAIASCGNAALAAAVLARAADRPLDVFVPEWADPGVVARLEELGAVVTVCPRIEGTPGDPTYHGLQLAIQAGAIPFTCQGNENGLAIESGETLGYEIASDLTAGGTRLDRIVVQVGGGALASSVIQGLREARALSALDHLPRLHAVQTEGGHPLKRAYERVCDRINRDTGGSEAEALAYAAGHRSEFMWPWEEEPKSIAHGITDDETYDWHAVVRGMIETGGHPVVVREETVHQANDLGRQATGVDVDPTGTSGLAGLIELLARDAIGPDERVAVLFTGRRR
jgi:threonine synthase